jgi:hypothetical protein
MAAQPIQHPLPLPLPLTMPHEHHPTKERA